VKRGLLREEEISPVERQITVDLVRRYLMIALNTVFTTGIKQNARPYDICLKENLRILNGSVNMGLRGKIHDDIRLRAFKGHIDSSPIRDIATHKREL
jgi:hypothetical protein